MVDWSEGDLQIDGINVHYYRAGQAGGPPVMLLHGFSDAGRSWTRLAQVLALHHYLVALDAAGHGRSGGPEHGFRERAASDVLQAMEALHLDRPVLVGHSMGAATAGEVAAIASDRLRGIVLEDPPWRDDTIGTLGAAPEASGSRAPLRSPAWVAWIESLKSLDDAELRALGHRERPEWGEVDRDQWAVSKAQFNLAVLDHFSVDAFRKPWRDHAAAITCPVLLITGDPALGSIVTAETAEDATRIVANLRVTHIPGADHNIRRSQWEPFSAAVTDFLAEVCG